MTTILLPTSPLPKSASPSPIVFGGWQTPTLGGEEFWLGRIGTRMSMAIETPGLKPEPDGRLWTATLLDALDGGSLVACRFPQPGFEVGAPGPSIVDGAGQAGMTLHLRGMTPFYAIRRRQFFHIEHQGRRYLHRATANTIVAANGRVSLPIAPMLRIAPVDGDRCEFDAPIIEGKLTGDAKGWTMVIARVQGLNFTISEIA